MHLVLYEFFYVLTGALLVFSGLEIIWPGVVLAYININWVLIFWLIIGMLLINTRKLNIRNHEQIEKR